MQPKCAAPVLPPPRPPERLPSRPHPPIPDPRPHPSPEPRRHFFVLLGLIFGAFAVAFAVLSGPANSYAPISLKLFTVVLGDFQKSDLMGMTGEPGMW